MTAVVLGLTPVAVRSIQVVGVVMTVALAAGVVVSCSSSWEHESVLSSYFV